MGQVWQATDTKLDRQGHPKCRKTMGCNGPPGGAAFGQGRGWLGRRPVKLSVGWGSPCLTCPCKTLNTTRVNVIYRIFLHGCDLSRGVLPFTMRGAVTPTAA